MNPCKTKSTLGYRSFVTYIDDISRYSWLFLMKSQGELFSIFKYSFSKFELNSILLFGSCAVIMLWNIFLRLLNPFYPSLMFFISLPMPMLHNKTELQNIKIIIWSKQLTLFLFLIMFHKSYVGMLSWLFGIWSIVYHPHSIIYPIQPLFFLPSRIFGCSACLEQFQNHCQVALFVAIIHFVMFGNCSQEKFLFLRMEKE